jgi:transcription initiation factor IIE alpha subunit
MLSTMDILATIEEETTDVEQLAKKLEIELEKLKKILTNLDRHHIIEYDRETGKVRLPAWLANVNKEMENVKPATGMIILPKNKEIKLQDITVGNFTDEDLELNVRLGAKQREIAISKIP